MKLTVTAAIKRFSEVLSRIDSGEVAEIERRGHTVAVIVPPQRSLPAGRDLLALIDRLPVPDEEFARDIASLGELVRPSVEQWTS